MPHRHRPLSLVPALALLGCLVAARAAAQAAIVTGEVVDDRTAAPISRVLITVDRGRATVTHEDEGRFTATVEPGVRTLVFSAIGYAVATMTVEAVAGQTTAVTVRLAEGAGAYTEHLDVRGAAAAPVQSPGGAMTLYGRDLQNLRGAILDDPLRAVQALPTVAATDDFYGEFTVRGSAYRQINLTVDGIASKYLMHTLNDIVDGGSVTMVNSEALGAIELLPGSYPQASGRHLGAEVNLLTRDGSRERLRGRAGLSGTSATLLVEGPLAARRGSWLVSARRSYLDYLIKRIDPLAGVAFGFSDGQVKLVYALSDRQRLEFITLLGRAAFNGSDEHTGINDTASATSHSWLSAAGWRYVSPRGIAINNRVFTTGLDFTNRNPAKAPLDAARFSTIGWRADAAVTTRAGIVEFGGDAQAMRGRHTRRAALPGGNVLITAGDYAADASAASAHADIRVTVGRLTVAPGVRVDRWSLTDSVVASPWLTAALRVRPGTTVTGGTGIYRQFAEFDQVYGLNGGGTALSPERSRHLDLGLRQQLPGAMSLQLSAFDRGESGVLWPIGAETRLAGGRIVGNAFNAPWTNALEGRAYGGEAVVRRDAAVGLSGWAGYAYAQLRYRRPAAGEAFWANADQRHTLSFYGNYRVSSRTSVSAKFRYGSNYPVAGYLTRAADAPLDAATGLPAYYQLTTVRNTVRLPPYARLDVRGDRAFAWGTRRVVLFVEVANVLNRHNLRNTPYSVDRRGRVFNVTERMMPIVPSAGFVVEF